MKRILLLAFLMAGYFAHAQSPDTTADRVGYANVDYIISQLPDMKAIEADIKSTQTQLRNQLQAKSQELEKQYAAFNANAKDMADTVRVNRQRDLEEAMAEFEQMQQDAQRTLENKQKLYMAPLYLKVNSAIREVARENGYSVILTQTLGDYEFLLYNQTQADISDLVLKKFGVTPPAKKE
jgi:outer membrane protein